MNRSSRQKLIRDTFLSFIDKDIREKNDIDNTPVVDLGMDSLEFLEFTILLEEEHGIRLSFKDLPSAVTLKQVMAAVSKDSQ